MKKREGFDGLSSIREIIVDPDALEKSLNRYSIEFLNDRNEKCSWESLAEELKQHEAVLCIVSDRKSCRILHQLMPKGTYHLSGLMCGQHRSHVIRQIKERLRAYNAGSCGPVRVISTQLVEAGVDIDFPIVYRAMAGLDSIAQAGGRCNREALLMLGKLKIINPPKPSPPGLLRKAEDVTRLILGDNTQGLLCNQNFEKFFEDLYWESKTLDKENIVDLLSKGHREGEFLFRTVSEKFRLINGRLSLKRI